MKKENVLGREEDGCVCRGGEQHSTRHEPADESNFKVTQRPSGRPMAEGNVARGGIKEENRRSKSKGERTVNKNATQPINFSKENSKKKGKKGRGLGLTLTASRNNKANGKKKHLTNSRPCLK